MRIHIQTTSNSSVVPFDYQQKLIGTIHKWLGNNEILRGVKRNAIN